MHIIGFWSMDGLSSEIIWQVAYFHGIKHSWASTALSQNVYNGQDVDKDTDLAN